MAARVVFVSKPRKAYAVFAKGMLLEWAGIHFRRGACKEAIDQWMSKEEYERLTTPEERWKVHQKNGVKILSVTVTIPGRSERQ